jgi:hypothetical protein
MDLLSIFAIFGLAFFIKETDGPWGIMSWIRNKLMTNKYIGVFFFKLLDCYFCLGCWCGSVIYLLHEDPWKFNLLICWGLAGGVISLIMNALLVRLYRSEG